MGTDIDKRTIQLHVRVLPSEYEKFKEKAAESGLSLSEYTRRVLIGEQIVAAPPADYFDLVREVKRVGSNLNRLLRKLNALGIVHDLELKRCEREIHETVKVLYQAFRPEKGVD